MKTLTVAIVALAALFPVQDAVAGGNDYKSPSRLRVLRQQDREVYWIAHRSWPRRILVERWSGNRFLLVGRDATIADLQRAAPRLVQEQSPGVWELRVPVVVVGGATLTVASPAVRELRLIANARTYATIVALNSNVRVVGTAERHVLVHSWVSASHSPDLDLDNGRGAISVRGTGRLDIAHGTFSYLGFTLGRASGVSVYGFGPQAKGTGAVHDSLFAHNVFGAYTWEAKNMRWIGNTFEHNIVYGFDPHDRSDGFIVAHNIARLNGRHGIIFSRFCVRNIIRYNLVYGNRWHGIVIDDGRDAKIGPSAYNVVYDNVVRNNGRVGISIDGSNHNVIYGNNVSGGRTGIRIFGRSYGNAIGNRVLFNTVRDSREIGIVIADPAVNTLVRKNTITGTVIGIAVHQAHRTLIADSTIRDVRLHGLSIVGGVRTSVTRNATSGSGPSPINRVDDDSTDASGNSEHWNYPLLHDLARLLSWFVGPGIWLLIFLAVLAGPGVAWGAERIRGVAWGR